MCQAEPSIVVLRNGSTLEMFGKKNINIKKLVKGMWRDGTISDVLYIPELEFVNKRRKEESFTLTRQ